MLRGGQDRRPCSNAGLRGINCISKIRGARWRDLKKNGKKIKVLLEYLSAAVLCAAGAWAGGSGKETGGLLREACLYKAEGNGKTEGKEQAAGEEKKAGEPKKKLALTFDDGPSPKYTPALLDGLKERKVKATFFVVGEQAQKYPGIIRRMHGDGHVIGNHTYHHVELTKVSRETEFEEIKKTNALLERLTGEKTVFIRPPYGAWRKEIMRDVELLPVLWDIDPLDWCTKNTGEIVRRVVTETDENAIILLHDCYRTSVEAALQIVDTLQKEGYRFVTVDELIID